jgi:hypothetical protein
MFKRLISVLFFVVLSFILHATPIMAEIVVRDSSSELAGTSQVREASFTATNTGETGNYLIIGAVSETSIITEMTFSGIPMTELLAVNTETGASGYVQIFGLVTSKTSGEVDVAYSGNIWGTQIYGYVFLDGVDTAAPVRDSAGEKQEPGEGTMVLTYDAGVKTGDFAFLVGNKNNRQWTPSAAPSDVTIFSGQAGASFSGVVAYDAALSQDDAYFTEFSFGDGADREVAGSMILASSGGSSGNATNPNPANQAEGIDPMVMLSWSPGRYVPELGGHEVYFGETFEDVNSASRTDYTNVIYEIVDVNSFETGYLEFGKTYYWRVDEVNAPPDSMIFKGSIWSFKTEPYAYPIEDITPIASSYNQEAGPENTINSSGLNEKDEHSKDEEAMWLSESDGPQPIWIQYEFDRIYKLHEMWIWNYNISFEHILGFGIKEVKIEYSKDAMHWLVLEVPEEAENFILEQGLGADNYAVNTIISFGGVPGRFVRLTVKSNYNGDNLQAGLSEVRFFYIPVHADNPKPAPGQADVDPSALLTWKAGRGAAMHELFINIDRQAVLDGTAFVDVLSETCYDLAQLNLQLGTTYYWKINEVNDIEVPPSWQGDIWSFRIRDFLVVDDFEDYNIGKKEIWWFWKDGLGYGPHDDEPGYAGNGTGSAVGNETTSSYMEETIVHGGRKSMPLAFDNTEATYSETEYTFDSPEDWTRSGIQTLTLYFYGDPANTGGQLYAKINGEKKPFDADAATLTRPRWTQWNIDLESVEVDLHSVKTLGIGVDEPGATGTVYLDDILLYRLAPETANEEIWLEAEAADTITAPMNVYSAIPGASGNAYIEAEIGNDSTDSPPAPNGTTSYSITVIGGTYRILARVITPGGADDSFWIRIQNATTNTNNHASGWIIWNGIPAGAEWHWAEVYSSDDGDKTVHFTMPAGTYTLEIGYREDGALLDALIITDKLN